MRFVKFTRNGAEIYLRADTVYCVGKTSGGTAVTAAKMGSTREVMVDESPEQVVAAVQAADDEQFGSLRRAMDEADRMERQPSSNS